MTRAFALFGLMTAMAVWPLATRADDYGPKRDVAAIRRDFPVLSASDLSSYPDYHAQDVVVDGVVVDGDEALAQLHLDKVYRINLLHRRLDRWWINVYPEVAFDGTMPNCSSRPASLRAMGISDTLIALAEPRLSALTMDWTPPPIVQSPQVGNVRTSVGSDVYCVTTHDYSPPWRDLSFQAPGGQEIFDQYPVNTGGYRVIVRMGANDGASAAVISDFQGRAPTAAESWTTLGGNSYFFFSGTVQSAKIVHVNGGTTLDVWFPFVLGPSLHYSLTVGGHGFTPLGPIDGTLANNTLHFVLPAFAAPPGVTMMGEIESYLSSSVTSD